MNTIGANRKILCDIAKVSFGIVSDWLSRDQRQAEDIRSATTGSRQIVGEETITVDLATQLRELFPKHVQLTLFTHPEESKLGADWYWRFEKGAYAINALVQAKRVQRAGFGEPDSKGHIDINHHQLAQLVQAKDAVANQIPGLDAWLATYARFDASPPCSYPNLQECAEHGHEGACHKEQPSLWIGKGEDFKHMFPSYVPLKKVIEKSLRLDCLLPCIDVKENPFPYGPSKKGFTLNPGFPGFEECVSIIQSDPELRSKVKGALRIY